MDSKDNIVYLKSGLWYTVGNILIKGIAFLALPIFTRILSPEDFGKYNVFLSYESIFNVIIGLGISGTIKVAFFDFSDKFNNYFSSIVSLTICSTLILDLLANIFILFFWSFNSSFWNIEMINLLFFSSLATALYNLFSIKYVIEVKYKLNLGISLIYTVTNILLSIILCLTLFTAERYMGRILGQTVPLILLSFGLSIYYIYKYKSIINFKYWSYATKLGFPLILHMLSMVLMAQIGKLMIDYFLGSKDTGIYSVAATLAAIVSLLLSCFDNAWAPWFYRGLADGKSEELKRGNNKISVFFAFIMTLIMLLSPEILLLMTTPEYSDSIYSIIPLTLAVYVNFMYLFAVNQEYYYKKTKVIALGTIVATMSGITLNYIFIPKCGYLTAAYVDLVCKIILYVIHTIVVKKLGKFSVVSHKLLLGLFVLSALIGIFSLYFKDNLIIRLIIITILIIPMYRPVLTLVKRTFK